MLKKLIASLFCLPLLLTAILPQAVVMAKGVKKQKKAVHTTHRLNLPKSKKGLQAQLWYWRKHPKIGKKQRVLRDAYESSEEARERAIVAKMFRISSTK